MSLLDEKASGVCSSSCLREVKRLLKDIDVSKLTAFYKDWLSPVRGSLFFLITETPIIKRGKFACFIIDLGRQHPRGKRRRWRRRRRKRT